MARLGAVLTIRPMFYERLAETAKQLTADPSLYLKIEGHTDWVGTAEVNDALSLWRAKNIARFLHKRHGIARHRLITLGYGYRQPRSEGQTDAQRALNRRAQLTLINKREAVGVDIADITNTVTLVGFPKGDSVSIHPRSRPLLHQIARILRRNSGYRLAVHGYTDNSGPATANVALSYWRARGVARYMAHHYGISLRRMSWHGHGEAKPRADNSTEAGRKKNRRVELEIVTEPKTAPPGKKPNHTTPPAEQ